ncbi:MAG: acyl-CoA dehydrogenase [Alphaproteobacteria bacterium]|nr:acyl-CoA dehydrogenase [Alphaproteobacteria bacterium]
MTAFDKLSPPNLPPDEESLRSELRAFLAESRRTLGWTPNSNFIGVFSAEFSRALGARGYLGMTWPKDYGGHARSALERYIVTEELLAAGAPCGAHWVADRQSGPLLLRFSMEAQRRDILPKIARGECYFSIGMSEPDSGSDLASVRTRATRTAKGWRIEGAKVWTSNAHVNHYAITLCRTGPAGEGRHEGLSQFLIDLKTDGVRFNQILNLLGDHEFNEMVFDGVEIPLDRLIGKEGDGWNQVRSELAFERSGPERFFGTFHLLVATVEAARERGDGAAERALGRLVAHFLSLRSLSLAVAGVLQAGGDPGVAAALVKDLGSRFELDVLDVARDLLPDLPSRPEPGEVETLGDELGRAILQVPSYSLRGGTPEIMRSIIARELGLR